MWICTIVPAELRQATLVRQVYSRRQLFEVRDRVYGAIISTSPTVKGDGYYLKTVDDRRSHPQARARLLPRSAMDSAHSPAMLTYLDNQVNRKGLPNENYAREVMELLLYRPAVTAARQFHQSCWTVAAMHASVWQFHHLRA